LEREEIIKKTDQRPTTYLPGKAPETVPLIDVLNIIREQSNHAFSDKNITAGVNLVMEKTNTGIRQATANETLAVLINKESEDQKD
ncbi:MAG: hypothetical protein ACC635_06365, partial [Acidiferrobacterales bacterium]